jgi:ubiquinone/menaquinone biosynthesis C-methylase UbiE
VDLTDAMLEQARLRVANEGWKNVELVQADAASYEFPAQVNGILSTFALTFISQAKLVIQNGCRALAPLGHGSCWTWPGPTDGPCGYTTSCSSSASLPMASPGEVVKRRPWQTVWSTMQQYLVEVEWQPFWMGFFYLAWGKQPKPPA